MRVLTYLRDFELGGVERVALRLVRHWRSLGADAPLFVGRDEGPLRAELAQDLDYMVAERSGGTLRMIAALRRHILRTRPDILFCAGNTYTIVAVMMKLLLGRDSPPVVVKISNDLLRLDQPAAFRFAWRIWLRIQARFVDHWVVMEEGMLGDVAATLGPVAHSVVPDPAIGEAQIVPAPPRAPHTGGRRFVAAGRLAPQKNYPLMLRAFALGAGPEDRLTILGDGPLRPQLIALAETLGIAAQVEFAGHVSNAPARIGAHDVLLLSSAYEGVPAILIEAMAVGLPIIATDCGAGVHALLGGGRFGRLTRPGDADDLGRAIAEADPAAPVDPATYAQARRFTIEAAAHSYLDVFARTLAHHRAARSETP